MTANLRPHGLVRFTSSFEGQLGELMTPIERNDIRVRYAETDQMGVVYYANFFVWFEVAA